MVTITAYLDCRKKKQDGSFPLKVRVSSNGKSFYLQTGISLEKKFWDPKKTKCLQICPNFKLINLRIAKRILAVEEIILLHDGSEHLSVLELRQIIERKENPIGVSEFTRQLITEMESRDKHGNAQVYFQALAKFESHFGQKIAFESINLSLLNTFHERMNKEGLSTNGISVYLRTLRAVYNKAIEAGHVNRGRYPFHRFKIKAEKTIVRALSIPELQKLATLKLEPTTAEWKAHRLFFLSFALVGMNLIDLCQLTMSNIQGERIHYRRQKTHKVYSVKITPLAREILDELSVDGHYLLPLLPATRLPFSEVKRISKQQTKNTNKHLKRIGEQLGLKLMLTTYVARHSWASTAKQLGYSNELIADAMGHSIGNSVTAVYLDKFSNEKVDEMNEAICRILERPWKQGNDSPASAGGR